MPTRNFEMRATIVDNQGNMCWTTERGGESVVTVLKQLCPF